jgi:NAD(P)-dependent dehydrogenase (short-subunit alcohol dehydrogenase family)
MNSGFRQGHISMNNLNGKNVVIIGGSQGVGREMVLAAAAEGANVLAVARRQGPLAELAALQPGVRTLAADMADETTPARIFETMRPDVLVVCAGATPPVNSLQDHTWETFSRVWENDVRGSFNICKAVLNAPLAPGSTVVLVSSGAGLAGSPISGGYAGAKRMQMFMAEYAQEESDRHGLGLRFLSIVPRYIMANTAVGKNASEGYAKYRGITVDQFLARFEHPQTTTDVADALITLVTEEPVRSGVVFAVDGQGIGEIQ